MNTIFLLPFVAGAGSLLMAALSLLRRRSLASWCFFAGMTALGLDSVFTGLSLRAAQAGDVVAWLTPAFVAKSFVPLFWLVFSLVYSRSNFHEFLRRWRLLISATALMAVVGGATLLRQLGSAEPIADVWWYQPGAATMAINIALLFVLVLILVNLEQTFRAAVGTMRWRIKFVLVALAVIFGARLYVRTQAILFSAPDIAFWSVESSGLLIGCVLLAIAYVRTGLAESDVYPSLAVLRSSFTVLVVGAYLLIVGIFANVVSRFGGAAIFRFQALIVLVGMAGLAILLLSDRARQQIHRFVARHFSKAQHDSVRIWTLFSHRLANVSDQARLCAASARLLSETFDVLSVTIWVLDDEDDRLTLTASTGPHIHGNGAVTSASHAVAEALHATKAPFDLDNVPDSWAEELRQLTPTTFREGGSRLCVPLLAGERLVGVIVLADRVNGAVYTVEELELLKCIGDHVTSVMMNVRLAGEVARARELEAFRLMSTFFVHDLKNAASSLNLMLKNLPVHFDDPAFRADALRSIGNTARRIDDMIARLSALRQRPDPTRVEADLNQLVSEALDKVGGMSSVAVTKQLQPLPRILADCEQIQSVVTNLVLNARDAVGQDGVIEVRTHRDGGRVLLSVIDNGCGMSAAFVKESLFRPFQSTKKKGLGIGLFQSRAIVQAHGGGMHVESEIGRGTTFLVSFPVKDAQ